MTTTTKKEKESSKEMGIDNYDDLNEAVMDIHRNIDRHDEPSLEVTEKLFSALTRGKVANSLTYSDPGVRIFKTGTSDQILKEEKMLAEDFRELEIKRARSAKGLA